MSKKEIKEDVSSNVGRGRGRGRGRTNFVEHDQPAPGVPISGPTFIGRGRANVGRGRGEAVSAFISTCEKPQRGSPPGDRSSPDPEKMESLTLEPINLMSRPGYGTLGRKCRLFSNHFEISISSEALATYRYEIEINLPDVGLTPDGRPRLKLSRDDNQAIFWKCFLDNKEDLGLTGTDAFFKVAFDGVHICLTSLPLNTTFDQTGRKTYKMQTSIPKKNDPIRVELSIQKAGQILVDFRQVTNPNLFERSCTPIQVVDILLRQNRSCPYSDCSTMYYPFRSSIYLIPGAGIAPNATHLGGGREIWKGLFTAAHVAQENQAMVNMDVDHTAFYKSSVIDQHGGILKYTVIQFLCDVLNESLNPGREVYQPSQLREGTALPDMQRKIFEREITGLKVCVDYKQVNVNDDREYRVHSVDRRSAADCIFEKAGTRQSVAEYYKETYGPLKYPRLFTLKIGPRQREGGPPVNPRRYINLPIERCYLAKNQKVMKKLTENQTALMIRTTCMKPEYRKEAIERMVHNTRFDEDPFLKNFGIHLNPRMVTVDGRVLPCPSIIYGGNNTVQIRDGVWKAGQTKFQKPSGARGIAAVAFSRAPDTAQRFVEQLMDRCRQYGMKVPANNEIVFHLEKDVSPQRVEIAFRNVLEKMKQQNKECELIIVLLPQKGTSLYADVKYMAEIQMGIMTQCVINKTVDRCSPDILMNLAFKINMKLGGINCTLSVREEIVQRFFKEPTLVLGIDVTHPGPTERKKPSVASVVGSMDLCQMRYSVSSKIQKTRTEHLVYLVDEVKERLLCFYKETQHKPSRILVYRDGVSEGQFEQVIREELRGIRQACANIAVEYRPKITFIVVQKRHHTRFFPEYPSDGCGQAQNVHPGTVVDSCITPSDDFVFYLCSHFGIQGTSRPTRYTVLKDDSNFSADDLQIISYYLCHCLSRCTRAVNIPAPVYYADLACTRARAHLQACMGDTLSDASSSLSGEGGCSSSLSEEELVAATTVTDTMRKKMYFI